VANKIRFPVRCLAQPVMAVKGDYFQTPRPAQFIQYGEQGHGIRPAGNPDDNPGPGPEKPVVFNETLYRYGQ
jgi:hypothetical protein